MREFMQFQKQLQEQFYKQLQSIRLKYRGLAHELLWKEINSKKVIEIESKKVVFLFKSYQDN